MMPATPLTSAISAMSAMSAAPAVLLRGPVDVSRAEVETGLRRRLDTAAARPSAETMAALRAAVTDVVDEMKARGVSREGVVSAVQALARDGPA